MTQLAKACDNWFYYWKTSSSLWKDKLESFPFNIIIVPIFWAFHADRPNNYDFGAQRPEADLKKLIELGEEMGKKIIFFLPFGPSPIFSNGGIPGFLKTSLSQNYQGHAYAVLNRERVFNKIYSFFDPEVFKEYCNFVKALGNYFTQEKINSDLYGVDCGFFSGKSYESFFNDRSNCFHKAFAKYIEASMEEDLFPGIKNPQEERQEIKKFTSFIYSLYKKAAKDALEQNWEGDLKILLLGGGTKDFIKRGLTEDKMEYFDDVLMGINQDYLPSAVLLDLENESNLFSQEFKDIVIDTFIPWKFSHSFMEDTIYSPLTFFQIYDDEGRNFQKNGLSYYLGENFGNTFSYFPWDREKFPSYVNNGTIYFIPGSLIDKDQFSKILKFFMNGGKVFIDCQGLSTEIKNKMDTFLLENSLKKDKIKFLVNFENVSLGEGRLFFFKGNEFEESRLEERKEFWQKVLGNIGVSHFHFESDSSTRFFWKVRLASPKEVNFQEIRRLCIYNPEKTKKKVKGFMIKNISLIKVEPSLEKRNENSDKIEIEIPPQSWVSVDFGIWA